MKEALDLIRSGRNGEAVDRIVRGLFARRCSMSRRAWRDYATKAARQPELLAFVHRCQMTRRSFEKPRGYAGDAVMLDHIYGTGVGRLAPHPATTDGQVYAYTVNAPAPAAVRYRREVLARLVDETVARRGAGNASVVSIACGHLREAELSKAMQARQVGRFVAIDQDDESLAVIDTDYADLGVETRHGSVRNIVTERLKLPSCDLIYAAGLYDYLDDKVGARLLQVMVEALNPGGRVLIANFVPNITNSGYMEACMDWWLLYRDLDQLTALFDAIPEAARGPIEGFFDPEFNIAFAVMEKPAAG
ncbi:MAG: class I SAM-dependent methyltransferase [Burkholderiales bacterium]|nr:class I SAM-dependent methyltransferase [Burkholderiales bacterium]